LSLLEVEVRTTWPLVLVVWRDAAVRTNVSVADVDGVGTWDVETPGFLVSYDATQIKLVRTTFWPPPFNPKDIELDTLAIPADWVQEVRVLRVGKKLSPEEANFGTD